MQSSKRINSKAKQLPLGGGDPGRMTDRRASLLREPSKNSAAFWQTLDETPSPPARAPGDEPGGDDGDRPSSRPRDGGPEEDAPNDIFRLVRELRWCLSELGAGFGADHRDRDVESWACLIYESMSGPSRTFHDVGHGFDITVGGDALLILSGLFHDVVYYSIDGGLSAAQARVLDGVIVEEEDGTVSLSETICGEDAHVAMVVTLFGFGPGQVLNPFAGLNEFLSAVLAVRCLQEAIHDSHLLQIAACIEATIPFRKTDENGQTASERLYDGFCKANADMASGITDLQIVKAVQRAVDLSNRDVLNFAGEDPAEFLSNTWCLLAESNISLRHDVTGKISSFVMALKRMYGFFKNLDPSTIFCSFRNEPRDDVVLKLTKRANKNIRIATKYLQTKILGLSLVAALAELTGGDAPLVMFVRGMSVDDYPGSKCSLQNVNKNSLLLSAAGRQDSFTAQDLLFAEDESEDESEAIPGHMSFIENFGSVRRTSSKPEHDEDVYSLLKHGRKVEAKFDLINSPVAAYLYGMLGCKGVDVPFQFCACPMDATNAERLLDSLPRDAVALIAMACSRIVLTRSQQLTDIADLYSCRVEERRSRSSIF